MFWPIWLAVATVFAVIGVINIFMVRAARDQLLARTAPAIRDPKRVGPVSVFNVDWLTRQYLEREDWTAWDFEERLDEFVRQSSRPLAVPEDDVTLVMASAAVLGQPSAGVIPRGVSVTEYADQLRRAGFTGTPIFEMGREEPVDAFADLKRRSRLGAPVSLPARCKCGALDSPNHRIMCWAADRAAVGSHLPGEPDEAY